MNRCGTATAYGCYALLINLTADCTLSIGKLGVIPFHAGYYCYIGSALNGLPQRITRHLRREKKLHWHIDYLVQHADIIDVFYKESNRREECEIAQVFLEKFPSIPGFGCSDCPCTSHLVYGSEDELKATTAHLQMSKYAVSKSL